MIPETLNKIWMQEGQEEICTPQNTIAKFELTYKTIKIGNLKLDNGEWIFEYDKNFNNQVIVQKLINFPDTNKQYKSRELWPFFSSRIPGLGQPKVKEIIKELHIDSSNEVELLKAFGSKTLTNPFLLYPV